MRLQVRAITNKEYVRVNTARLKMPSGTVLIIDRDETEFSICNGELDMVWHVCYLWGIDDDISFETIAYLDNNDSMCKTLNGCSLSLELEDDVDDDYEVTVEEWSFF